MIIPEPNASIFAQLPEAADAATLLKLRCDSQSAAYYADISHFLCDRVRAFDTLSVLDVGSRTGSGLAFLRLMHHPQAFTRLKLDPVAGIDIDPMFERTAREFPDIQSTTGDIFNLSPKCYDLVICSHTIEHILETEAFVRQLENIARKYVVLACPFEEREPLSAGHVRRIDRAFLSGLGFKDLDVYDSFQFHNGLCCLAIKDVRDSRS